MPGVDKPTENWHIKSVAERPLRVRERIPVMFYTIVVVLLLLWLVGMVTSYTLGGLIHVLIVIAIVVVLLRVIRGKDMFGRKN
jgi:hypothetical protein